MTNENNQKMSLPVQQLTEIYSQSSNIIACIVSQTPGRLRLRVAKQCRKQEEIERIAPILQERLQIYSLRTNLQTGSITILYAEEQDSFEQISCLLRQLGVSLEDSLSQPQNINDRSPFGKSIASSEAAAEVISTFSQLDRKVKLATEAAIDLRFLLPFGFSILALRQLLVKGLALEAIPWYVLAWYAFDSFIKLHYSLGNQPITTDK